MASERYNLIKYMYASEKPDMANAGGFVSGTGEKMQEVNGLRQSGNPHPILDEFLPHCPPQQADVGVSNFQILIANSYTIGMEGTSPALITGVKELSEALEICSVGDLEQAEREFVKTAKKIIKETPVGEMVGTPGEKGKPSGVFALQTLAVATLQYASGERATLTSDRPYLAAPEADKAFTKYGQRANGLITKAKAELTAEAKAAEQSSDPNKPVTIIRHLNKEESAAWERDRKIMREEAQGVSLIHPIRTARIVTRKALKKFANH